MSPGYVYKGTQRGDADPWNAPEPEPKPPRIPRHTIPLQPCGTRAAHERHKRLGEDPCPPCLEAKRNYDRDWRATWEPTPEQARAKKERDRQWWIRNGKQTG